MLEIEVDAEDVSTLKPAEKMIAEAFAIPVSGTAADAWLLEVAKWTWRVKLSFSLAMDLMMEMRERAEEEAIRVFARNLKRSEEHTSELQSLMRISYAVFCLKKKKNPHSNQQQPDINQHKEHK